MGAFLSRFSDHIYANMRIIVGVLFACHGSQKLFGLLGGQKASLASLMGLAGFIEFFGGLLVALGFFTTWAAFISSGLMAVAYFMAHASGGFWPIENKGELAVLYCFIFLTIAATGAKKWSLGRTSN